VRAKAVGEKATKPMRGILGSVRLRMAQLQQAAEEHLLELK
jgi:hypothetical protein